MSLANSIIDYCEKQPGPWLLSAWTIPQNGQSPANYSAGFFRLKIEKVNVEGGEVYFVGNEGLMLLVASAIGQVEPIVIGEKIAIRFVYINVTVPLEDFAPYPMFTLEPEDVKGEEEK